MNKDARRCWVETVFVPGWMQGDFNGCPLAADLGHSREGRELLRSGPKWPLQRLEPTCELQLKQLVAWLGPKRLAPKLQPITEE